MDYLGGPKMPSQVLLLERKREISTHRRGGSNVAREAKTVAMKSQPRITATLETGRARGLSPGGCHWGEHCSVDSDFKSVTLILNSGFQNCERTKFCCFKPLNCW